MFVPSDRFILIVWIYTRSMASGQPPPSRPGSPSLRSEQIEATRRAIVAAARRRFGHAGYAATSVDDIAADARVTKGAVYHHFGSKDRLFRAVYDDVESEVQALTAQAGD